MLIFVLRFDYKLWGKYHMEKQQELRKTSVAAGEGFALSGSGNGYLELTGEDYRTICENSPVAITVTNKDERIVYWNRFAELLLGMDAADLYMRPVETLYPEDEWKRIRAQDVRQKGMQHYFETKVIRKDGQIVDVMISLSVLKGQDGAVRGSIGIISDATERKKAEEALRSSKELFEKTFNSQPHAIFILDASVPAVILDCNVAATKIFGYSRDEMLGRTTAFLHIDESTLKEFQKRLYPAVERYGYLHLPEFHMKRRDGSEFTTEHYVVPLTSVKGERIGWVSVVQDITERKKAEHALKQSEELSKAMLETATAGIYLSQHGRFTYVNRRMEEICGYSSDELLGTLSVEYVHPDDRKIAREKAIECLKGQRTVPYEFRVIRKDLEIVWVSERVTSIEYGGYRAILGTLTDITERKMAESLYVEHTKQLEALFSLVTGASRTLDLNALLEGVLKRTTEAVRAKAGAVFLIDQQHNELMLRSSHGFSDEFCRRVAKMKVGRGFAGRVALSGKPSVVSNSSHDKESAQIFLSGEGIESLCSVPILVNEEVLGVICVGKSDLSQFAKQNVRLLSSIAAQIGIAIVNAQLYEKTARMAFTDELTGLYNRRFLTEELERELGRARRKQTQLSLLMIDMDGLKSINDRFGHHHGSALLKQLGSIIKANTRVSDVAARYGGDEFVLLAPDTNSTEAAEIGERLRAEANSYRAEIDGWETGLTISVGIATFPAHGSDSEKLLRKADEALYEAKRAGKNRVCVASPSATALSK
jgi:diguanylate cyclase (GGDEF)-like protein/PAS domain S-box-containing protein